MKIYYLKCKCAKALLLGLLSLFVLQCKQQLDVPDTYSYTSRFDSTKSSVNYASQTFRHVLIQELTSNIDKLSGKIEEDEDLTASKVKAELTKYYKFDSTNNGMDNLTITSKPSPKQKNFNDLKSDAPNLKKKIAGNDKIGQHKDWSKDFVGWKDTESMAISPDDLIQLWFTELATLMENRSTAPENEPGTINPITKHYVSVKGLDYQQLIQKFLGVAIAWSQGSDDYLDNDTPTKGLQGDNSKAVEGKSYTELEHHWDEAFGYFGSAHDYGSYTDEEIKKEGYNDTDKDGTINLLNEYNFGHSTNSAKRDKGVENLSPTDFTRDIFLAFRQGRSLISSNEKNLNETDLEKLIEYRDTILQVWEKTIASTVVHYINDVLKDMVKFDGKDMVKFDGTDYKFLKHAQHWSELKGFSLGLQFNRLSPLSKENFVKLHEHIGQQPVLSDRSDTDKSEYKEALLEARGILKTAYQFSDKNIGDEDGKGGW